MNELTGAIILMLAALVVWLWLRIMALEEKQEKDTRYLEWWLKKMEEGKQDKHEYKEEWEND